MMMTTSNAASKTSQQCCVATSLLDCKVRPVSQSVSLG